MEEAARKEAEEAERKKREAEEAAKVAAARKAAEQAAINALGMEGKITEYTRLLENPDISNADRFEYQKLLDRLLVEKKKADDEKRKLEEERKEAERVAQQKAA